MVGTELDGDRVRAGPMAPILVAARSQAMDQQQFIATNLDLADLDRVLVGQALRRGRR